jgi:hypothetical protein
LKAALSGLDYERFMTLCDAAKVQYLKKMQEEETFDNYPDEFEGRKFG